MFFIGVFATLFASISGKTTAFPMLITDAFQHVRPERREKYGKEFHHDPMHKWFILVTPLVWSLPGMPDFVTLTIGVSALNIIGLPVISLQYLPDAIRATRVEIRLVSGALGLPAFKTRHVR